MAKRHHGHMKKQTHMDRMHESEGMKHKMHEGHYEGHHGRRNQEMMDSGMISEDHSAIANLPQNVMMKPYPRPGGYMPEDLDDTIRGIDEQMSKDNSKMEKHLQPEKY